MNKFLTTIIGTLFLATSGCQVISGDRTINEYGSDAAMTANVKAELLADKRVTSLPIHVATEKGMVVLSGFVKTNRQKLAASQAAHRAKDVKEVKNNLIIR
ncbi:MAG: BON domain-containing protein [Legionella sp.]|nr:BON domain-containing protein [Legionella sp.]